MNVLPRRLSKKCGRRKKKEPVCGGKLFILIDVQGGGGQKGGPETKRGRRGRKGHTTKKFLRPGEDTMGRERIITRQTLVVVSKIASQGKEKTRSWFLSFAVLMSCPGREDTKKDTLESGGIQKTTRPVMEGSKTEM